MVKLVIMPDEPLESEILFRVKTPLGFYVRVTRAYWAFITTVKHPIMAGQEAEVEQALSTPDEVRLSRIDPNMFLFYRLTRPKRWVCAVAKRPDDEAFLVTAYPTDAVKEGRTIWQR